MIKALKGRGSGIAKDEISIGQLDNWNNESIIPLKQEVTPEMSDHQFE